jgi:GntR family transcriptional repressor for pyruvate dehydrogenase complex
MPGPRLRHVAPVWLLEGVDVLIEVAGSSALIEATETRRLLEPGAAALAAERVTPDHLAEIGHLMNQCRMARPCPEVMTRYDAELHRVIAAAAGNRALEAMAGRLVARTARARLWRSVAAAAPPVAWRTELETVHQALQARDPELARFTAEAHVQACETFLRAMARAVVSPAAGSAAGIRSR